VSFRECCSGELTELPSADLDEFNHDYDDALPLSAGSRGNGEGNTGQHSPPSEPLELSGEAIYTVLKTSHIVNYDFGNPLTKSLCYMITQSLC